MQQRDFQDGRAFSRRQIAAARRGLSMAARHRLFGHLARRLTRGATLQEAIEAVLSNEANPRGRPTPSEVALESWLLLAGSGRELYRVVADWAPADEVMVLESAESDASQAAQLLFIVEHGRKKAEMGKVIRAALSYPAVVGTALVLILGGFGWWVVPGYLRYAAKMHVTPHFGLLPQSLIWVSAVVRSVGPAVPVVLLAAIAWVRWALPNWTARSRVAVEHLWPFSIYKTNAGVSFLHALATLVGSGSPPEQALRAMLPSATPYVRSRLVAILEHVTGRWLGEAAARAGLDFPGRRIVNDLKGLAGEAHLDTALRQLADDWQVEAMDDIRIQSERVKTILTGVMWGVFLWMYLGLMALQFSMVPGGLGAIGF